MYCWGDSSVLAAAAVSAVRRDPQGTRPPNGARWVFLTGITLLAACAARRLAPPSTDIDETAYRTHVSVLASDDFEGRRPGTNGEAKTLDYLVEQFRKLHLQPGNGESFLQQVPLIEIRGAEDAPVSVTGSRGTAHLAYGKDVVTWSGRATAQAQLQHSELVFLGYGIVAPEYAWNDYAGVDVHGKTVVVLANDPGFSASMTRYGRWTNKVEEAAQHGASGVLLVHNAAASGFGWSVVQNTWMSPQLQRANRNEGVEPVAIAGWLSADAARALFAQAGLDFGSALAAATRPGFKAMPMGLRIDASLQNSIRRINSANAVALLPGSARRREYIIYTAHWDHLGSDPNHTGHSIYNGAVDNASGVAGLLALAQSFARTNPAPDRSVVFLVLTGGESELLGSSYYVQNPLFPLKATAAVLNLDSLRSGGPTRDVNVIGYGNTDLEEYAGSAALLQGRAIIRDPMARQGEYFRSDSFSFAKAGVPVLYAKGGFDDAARGPAY